jgi:hypothetical protein
VGGAMPMKDDPGWSLIFEGLERVSNELDEAWTVLSDQPLVDRGRFSLPEAIRRALARGDGGAGALGDVLRLVPADARNAIKVGRAQIELRPNARGADGHDLIVRSAEAGGAEIVVETTGDDRRALVRLLESATGLPAI